MSGAENNFVNDLVVLEGSGDAYVTDTANAMVYLVPGDGTAPSVFLRDIEGWTPNSVNGLTLSVNGIEAFSRGGSSGPSTQYLLVGLSLRGNSLYRVNVGTSEVAEVDVSGGNWATNAGIDGLRCVDSQCTVLGAVVYLESGSLTRPVLLHSDDDWASATVLDVDMRAAVGSSRGAMYTTCLLYTSPSPRD